MKSGQWLAAVALGTALLTGTAQAQMSMEARVTALKESLTKSKANLRKYQWIETTTVSLNGAVRSTKQTQNYYDATGTLVKVPLDASAAQAPGGLRGRIAAKKKEEMTDYMESAVALLKSYVPPQAERIEAARAANNITLGTVAGGVDVVVKNYLTPGDRLAFSVDPATNKILGLAVASSLDTPANPITLSVTMGQLPDGTTYAATSVLNAPAKGLTVQVQNSGYSLR